MQSITSSSELQDAILQLQQKQAEQGQQLKIHFDLTIESFKPANPIRSIISEVITSPDILSTIISASLRLTAGYFSKKLIIGAAGNILKKLLGSILQFSVPAIMAKNPEAEKSLSEGFTHGIFSKKDPIS